MLRPILALSVALILSSTSWSQDDFDRPMPPEKMDPKIKECIDKKVDPSKGRPDFEKMKEAMDQCRQQSKDATAKTEAQICVDCQDKSSAEQIQNLRRQVAELEKRLDKKTESERPEDEERPRRERRSPRDRDSDQEDDSGRSDEDEDYIADTDRFLEDLDAFLANPLTDERSGKRSSRRQSSRQRSGGGNQGSGNMMMNPYASMNSGMSGMAMNNGYGYMNSGMSGMGNGYGYMNSGMSGMGMNNSYMNSNVNLGLNPYSYLNSGTGMLAGNMMGSNYMTSMGYPSYYGYGNGMNSMNQMMSFQY